MLFKQRQRDNHILFSYWLMVHWGIVAKYYMYLMESLFKILKKIHVLVALKDNVNGNYACHIMWYNLRNTNTIEGEGYFKQQGKVLVINNKVNNNESLVSTFKNKTKYRRNIARENT